MKLPAPELYIYKSSPDHHGQPKNDCNHLYFFLPSPFGKFPGKFSVGIDAGAVITISSHPATHTCDNSFLFLQTHYLNQKQQDNFTLTMALRELTKQFFFFGQKRRHVSNDNSLLSSIYQSLAVWLKYYVTDTRKRHLLIFQPICKQHCLFFFC